MQSWFIIEEQKWMDINTFLYFYFLHWFWQLQVIMWKKRQHGKQQEHRPDVFCLEMRSMATKNQHCQIMKVSRLKPEHLCCAKQQQRGQWTLKGPCTLIMKEKQCVVLTAQSISQLISATDTHKHTHKHTYTCTKMHNFVSSLAAASLE